MRALWRAISRTIFWSYERGSWPYDLMVVAIVIFVLLTPRKWFHDQQQTSALGSPSVQLVYDDTGNRTRMYRLDAAALAPEKRAAKSTPELERETHDILGRTVGNLKDQTFQVLRIDPVISGDGSVLYYEVIVHI
jgi:hypothetical protein